MENQQIILPFAPNMQINNGLNIAYISNIYLRKKRVLKYTNEELKEINISLYGCLNGEFFEQNEIDNLNENILVPELIIEFTEVLDTTFNKRIYNHSYSPIDFKFVNHLYRTINDKMSKEGDRYNRSIIGGINYMYENFLVRHINHIILAYQENLPKTNFELDSIKSIKEIYDDFEKHCNMYISFFKENNIIPTKEDVKQKLLKYIWIKLIFINNKLTLPKFIGNGFIEKYFSDSRPMIKLTYNEKIDKIEKSYNWMEDELRKATEINL